MNLFIESIEGGTYLVALGDELQRDYVLDTNDTPITFQCLTEIKSYFNGQSFDQVWLRQNTPYDEMCGLNAQAETLELEIEW